MMIEVKNLSIDKACVEDINVDGYKIEYDDDEFTITRGNKEIKVNFNNNSIWVTDDDKTNVYLEY